MSLSNFTLAFTQTSRNSDQYFLSSLSPNGSYLASSGGEGLVSLLYTKAGTKIGILDFGHSRRITALQWIDDSRLLMGNTCGEIQIGRLCLGQSQRVDNFMIITTLMHKADIPVLALAYDLSTGFFAFANQHALFVFRLYLERARSRKWRLISEVECDPGVCDRKICSLQFLGIGKGQLYVGMNQGAIIWTGPRQPTVELGMGDISSGKCVVSHDGRFLAISTNDLQVVVIPVLPNGIDPTQQHTFRIPMGRNYIPLILPAPICFTHDNKILTADPFGRVYMLNSKAEEVTSLSFGGQYSYITSIICHASWMYLTSVSCWNTINTDAFSNDATGLKELRVAEFFSDVEQKPIVQKVPPASSKNRAQRNACVLGLPAFFILCIVGGLMTVWFLTWYLNVYVYNHYSQTVLNITYVQFPIAL
ncbi:hypothetical protein BDV93DRAFT_565701 [Ceratobasidium sp. AG-I]|nr:hypothetical protein BDV93DRAFT_565701 [Ceratobasidium sp. AG-I]